MKIGVHLPQFGPAATRESVRDFAVAAEELGFASLWVSDHIVVPRRIASRYPYSRTGDFPVPPDLPFLEPIATLTFVSGCTERIELGTTVLVLPMRNPILTAKQLATLDVLSGGRLILGVGAGWMEEEFDALGEPFSRRGARLDEQLLLLRALWTERVVEFEGEFYRLPRIGFAPKPMREPSPPLWVGGHSAPARRRAATFGDAWHAVGSSAERIAEEYDLVRSFAAGLGRDVALTARVGVHLDDEHLATAAETIAAFERIGASHVVVEPAGLQEPEATVRRLERLSELIDLERPETDAPTDQK